MIWLADIISSSERHSDFENMVSRKAIAIAGDIAYSAYGQKALETRPYLSFGTIYGWGAKLCIQQKVSSCTGN